MHQSLVTVIIPCYNYGNFIIDAVKSVRAQTHTNWECLIIDDGSEDNTRAIGERFEKSDERISYHYKINGGLSSARNYGLRLAKGNYVSFLDADDLFDKEKLERQLEAFASNSAADIVYGNAMFFEKNNTNNLYLNKLKNEQFIFSRLSGKGEKIIDLICRQNITVVSSPLISKKVFTMVGDFDLSYKSYEDWHFWMRCALADFYFMYLEQPKVCTYIRFGHESMMSDKRKLLTAGIQLRKYMALHLPLRNRAYNYYRLVKSKLKLLIS